MSDALLILSCSKRKKSGGKRPAIELYDGPAFRVLRKFLRNRTGSPSPDVLILSAKFGLISAHKKIAPYEKPMATGEAVARRQEYTTRLPALVGDNRYREVFVNLGADYLGALPPLSKVLIGGPRIFFARGRIGNRLHQMKLWLTALPNVPARDEAEPKCRK